MPEAHRSTPISHLRAPISSGATRRINDFRPDPIRVGARFAPIAPEMAALYRQATPEAKLAVVARLNAGLQALKEAELVAREPQLSAMQRRAKVRHWWLTARD